MPPEEQGLDLEQLKVDPRVWQRLATPLDGSNVLGNVFVDEKENPFQKDPKGSMEKIQSLAAAGKLYLRDLGRSRHFHKVEKDGDNLKLGQKHEMKLSNRNIDLPLSILMWATGKYLRSWGLESIPNWFDKKREERAAINKMEAQYKEEYKGFTKEQKKALKDLRKQEKQEAKQAKQDAKLQRKLDQLKKEAEKTQKELDKLRGVTTSNTQNEVQNQQTTPPQAEQQKTDLQPTVQGEQLQQTQPTQNQIVAEPPAGQNNENTVNNYNKIVFGNKEYTPETFNKLPPNIQNAIKTIMSLIEQQEAIEQQLNQQLTQLQTGMENTLQQTQPQPNPNENQPEQVTDINTPAQPEQVTDINAPVQPEQVTDINAPVQTEQVVDINEIPAEEPPQREGTLIDVDDFQPTVNENNTQTVNLDVLQEIFPGTQPQPQETNVPTADTNAPTEDINAPAVDINAPLEGIQLEPENVNIQNRPEEQPQPTLKERLAAERQAMDVAANWRDSMSNALLSHPEANDLKEYYDSIKDDKRGTEFMTGAISGMLYDKTASIETKLHVIESVLSGKSIGSENNALLESGITAFNQAVLDKNQGNGKELAKMLATSMRALIRMAGMEDTLSPRFAMYGRMLSGMAAIANENGLELPMNQNELKIAHGVATAAEVARKYCKARQHLGQDGVDPMAPENRKSVRDLMLGNAVEKLIQTNLREAENSDSVLSLMGEELWNAKFLEKFASESIANKAIQPEDVNTVLENPNSSKAYGLGTSMVSDIVAISSEVHDKAQEAIARENALEAGQNEPQINPVQNMAP